MLVPSPSHWAALVASCGKGTVASHVLDISILRGNWKNLLTFWYMKKQEHHSFGLDMDMFGTLLEFYLEKQSGWSGVNGS